MFRALITFLGRLCLSVIFIGAGLRILLNWSGAEQALTGKLCDWLMIASESASNQAVIEKALNFTFLLTAAAVFCLIIGGVLTVFGSRMGTFLLILFLIPTTLLFHPFWTIQGADRELEMTMFLKNMAILGGLLILISSGGRCKGASSKKPEA